MSYIDNRGFKARRYRVAADENIKLDKIRSGGDRKQKGFGIWLVIAVAVVFLVSALMIPRVAEAVKARKRTNARSLADDTRDAILEAHLGAGIPNRTIFMVSEDDEYYLFWWLDGKMLAIDRPEGYPMQINIEKGKELTYPFESAPIIGSGSSIRLMSGLEVLEGYEITEFVKNDELEAKLKKSYFQDVKLYRLKQIGEK